MEMSYKNYCIVALGDISGIIDIIKKISESSPRKLEQRGVLICTFSSVMTTSEIKETINEPGKTFFIFEVDSKTSAYKIGRDDIHEQLFNDIEKTGKEFLNTLTNKLMSGINNDTSTGDTTTIKVNIKKNEVLVTDLSKKEIGDEIDMLLDKGLGNLNNDEKEWLKILTENM